MRSEPHVAVWAPAVATPARPLPDGVEWMDADTLASAAAKAGRADLAIILPGVRVLPGWLKALHGAAHCDSVIATASAMLSEGPWAPAPLGDPAVSADRVAAGSARRRPRISEPLAGAVLITRAALDVAGPPAAGGSIAAALADLAQRCSAVGLGHVLADDVLAFGAPAAPADGERAALDAAWPHRAAAREHDARPESPIEHALLVASRRLDRLSVTIDGRALGPTRAGTQMHALELIAALGRTGEIALRVITPPDLDPQARSALEAIDDLELLPYATAANDPPPPTDIVHRPSQVFSVEDLTLLLPLGRRLVVTHQDLISYRIPGYHDSVEHWLRYRQVTKDTLAAADHVVFFSEHARADASADDLVDPASTSVVAIGVDHHVSGAPARRPQALPDETGPYLLCLGARLRHKNHAFATALLGALRARGWNGRLVFAGPEGNAEVPAGESVVQLGPVGEDEKAWLFAHAAAVVYPTLYEGFGLIPFEAAAAGTPCLFAPQASLAEVFAPQTATLVAWDADASAAAVAPLLRDGPARDAHVHALRTAAAGYRWDDAARAMLELYDGVLLTAPREARRAPRERLWLQQRLAETQQARSEEWQRHLAFREEIGDDGLGLVGPGGLLGAADQRALLALMSRGPLRRPMLRIARAAYALALALRRRR